MSNSRAVSVSNYMTVKQSFYELVGSFSIEEVVLNEPLVEQIEELSSLLAALTAD